MKAIRIERFGGPEVLQRVELQMPEAGPGEYVVKIRAASVNPVDWKIREGSYFAVKADKLPYVLGRDLAGEVVARGAGARDFAEGDAVFAFIGIDRGAYAEYAVVKESEAALKPHRLDFVSAGAVPLAAMTAWQGLFRHGGLKPGQRVLIQGGSGGVGHFAVQFAKAKGAEVITTVSSGHVDLMKRLGADVVIDYKRQRFEDEVRDVDLVYDLISGETQDRSWGVLKKGGVLVGTLAEPSQEKARAHGVRALRYTVTEDGRDLKEIGGLIESGKVAVVVSKTFALHEAAAAQEYVRAGHTEGKVVLTVP